mmetsp:Transcript_27375/g.64610  ORF Transcript_27375/g.64610 Transcript_27375/m.64610 type:complete len:215 (-) Transcript_27375:54-698(-)
MEPGRRRTLRKRRTRSAGGLPRPRPRTRPGVGPTATAGHSATRARSWGSWTTSAASALRSPTAACGLRTRTGCASTEPRTTTTKLGRGATRHATSACWPSTATAGPSPRRRPPTLRDSPSTAPLPAKSIGTATAGWETRARRSAARTRSCSSRASIGISFPRVTAARATTTETTSSARWIVISKSRESQRRGGVFGTLGASEQGICAQTKGRRK